MFETAHRTNDLAEDREKVKRALKMKRAKVTAGGGGG